MYELGAIWRAQFLFPLISTHMSFWEIRFGSSIFIYWFLEMKNIIESQCYLISFACTVHMFEVWFCIKICCLLSLENHLKITQLPSMSDLMIKQQRKAIIQIGIAIMSHRAYKWILFNWLVQMTNRWRHRVSFYFNQMTKLQTGNQTATKNNSHNTLLATYSYIIFISNNFQLVNAFYDIQSRKFAWVGVQFIQWRGRLIKSAYIWFDINKASTNTHRT